MKQNAEFIRNLWLQISAARLIGAAAMIALVVIVIFASVTSRPWEVVMTFASAALSLVLIFWGATVARATIHDEIRANTWNQQRMSGLTPWQITWGKLFGGTAFIWCISLAVLLLWCVARVASGDAQGLLPSVLTWLAAGVATHAVAMIAAVGFRSSDGSRVEPIPVGVLIVALLVATQSAVPFVLLGERGSRWYGHAFTQPELMLLLIVPIALWAVIGARRSIQREMQETLAPWALPLALLCFGFLFAGFVDARGGFESLLAGFVVSFGMTAAFAWAAFFAEPQSILTTRECVALFAAGRVREALSQLTTASVLLVTLGMLSVICAIGSASLISMDQPLAFTRTGSERALLTLAPVIYVWVVISALRDFCVAHLLQTMSRNGARAMGTFGIYIAVMYVAVPLLLDALINDAKDFWMPTSTSPSAFCLIGAFASLALVCVLVRRQWHAAIIAPIAQLAADAR